MADRKGADLITEFLVKEKVPYVFGICGHGNVGMLDALYEARGDITLISPRHEQVAGHMADGYFRVKHAPAATLTSCGPGSANLVMALAVALTDSSAFFAITANVPTSQFNRSPFQEINRHYQADFPNVIRPVVKRSYQPTRVDMLPLALRQGFATMITDRPGPVQIDVPFNLFQETAEVALEHGAPRTLNDRRAAASADDIARAIDMLLAAERPLLFIGHGVALSEASAELTALARRLSIPVISSPNGMGCLDMEDPLSLGFIGRNGAYPANQAGRHADLVLAVGARFDDRSSSSWMPGYSWNFPTTQLIHVDVDPAEIGRNYAPDLGILADARTFLRQMVAELDGRDATPATRLEGWWASIRGWAAAWDEFVAPRFGQHTSPIRPERIVEDCQRVLPPDAILTFDAGVHHNWFMQFWKARRPQTMLNSWGYSGMGFGPASVLGAKLAAPDKVCVSVCGDGGFTMVPHVLCTAVEYDIAVVWVVWNNFAWGAIRDIQYGLFDGREIGTAFYAGPNQGPYNPDFAAWARAAGVEAITVTRSEDFAGALETAVKANRPFLIDVHVDADIRPPATGAWALPPTPHKEPVFGERFIPTNP
ncbi:thiamine pyrophosphate-binding protein [Azospirillum sp. RWY-5-1]|uniref:Thiamine pyrophosphate-binding protein n=1 Tax=Azospirillum oleiclasticum TaxID=2735135 RepID=A0ABX2TKZ0_9PROT|nr:thiamine pyrophosphate-binding protein [Azospirillum oleiclasticum]NYZ17652.1 thiamine pyrophosphate-binding protein [Azospirillum oleiclasticum]NYZ25007.1 thiamine pyrophosphate-binding protein [Azospirillum oleiclasticum]